ncbi:MAG: HlyD family secretion protein [Anaerolineales bacterium]
MHSRVRFFLLLSLCLGPILLVACQSPIGSPSEPSPTIPSTQMGRGIVSATGKVVPAIKTELAFSTGGRVTEVAVEQGEEVTKDQILAHLDASQFEAALAEAEAALSTARRDLALTKAGPRTEQTEVAEAAVHVAEENKRHAEISVEQAEINVKSAQASLAQAEAFLHGLKAGPTADELEVAQQTVEQAKAQLYGYQGQRDAIGGRKGTPGYQVGSYEAAEGQVMAAENAVTIAELQHRILASGASIEDIDAAEARVAQAQASVEAARVQERMAQQEVSTGERQLEQARADLALARAPAREEQVRVAEAGVAQAEAAVERAKIALAETVLRAPFAGTVARIELDLGESVIAGTPIISLGDLERFQIKTTDLDEIDVARVDEGQSADLTFDALPDVRLEGTVQRIDLKADTTAGGITYQVIIDLDEMDPRLRWGMTAFVDIEVN